jgi:hypothetical protein
VDDGREEVVQALEMSLWLTIRPVGEVDGRFSLFLLGKISLRDRGIEKFIVLHRKSVPVPRDTMVFGAPALGARTEKNMCISRNAAMPGNAQCCP